MILLNKIPKKIVLGVFASLFLLMGLVSSPHASAAPGGECGTYSCTGQYYPKAPMDVKGDVSISGHYAVTNNSDSWFEVTDVSASKIKIEIRYECGAGQLGFQVYSQGIGSLGTPNKIIEGTDACVGGEGASGTKESEAFQIPSGSFADGYNAVLIDVAAIGINGRNGHIPFNIRVNKVQNDSIPWISYAPDGKPTTAPNSSWDPQERQFGVWMGGINFGFQPPCDYSGGGIFLKWSGADDGASYQPITGDPDKDLYTDLFDASTGKVVWSTHYYATLNGQASTGPTNVVASNNKPIPVKGGHKYIWRWRNVSGNNEIALSVPFSQNNYGDPCNQQPRGTIYSLQCDYMKGAVADDDYIDRHLPYKIVRHDNNSGANVTLYDSWQDGDKRATSNDVPGDDWEGYGFLYNHRFSNLKPQYTFQLYTFNVNDQGVIDAGSNKWIKVDEQTKTKDCTDADAAPTLSIGGNCDYVGINMSDDNSRGTLQYTVAANPTDWNGQGGDWPGIVYKFVKLNENGPDGQGFFVQLPRAPLGHGWRVIVNVNNVKPDGSIEPWKGNGTSQEYTTANCYQATCSVKVNGNVPGGGDGEVKAGEDFSVEVTINNTGPGTLWTTAYEQNGNGHGLSATQPPNTDFGDGPNYKHNTVYPEDIPPGESRVGTIHYTAPNNINTYSPQYYPDYAGWGSIGGGCSGTVKTFQHFTIDPLVNFINMDWENPTQVNYRTGGNRTEGPETTVNKASELTRNGTSVHTDSINRSYDTTPDDNYNNYTYTPPSISAGDKYCATVTINPATGWLGPSNVIRSPAPASKSAGCPRVANEPYVHAFGSDVSAGGGFGVACSVGSGGINTYLKSTGTSTQRPAGSGVQIGALSINPIFGFSSATQRSESPFGSTGLSFSNTQNVSGSGPGAPGTGGNLGGSHCVSDFFKDNKVTTGDPSTGPLGLNQNTSATWYYTPPPGSPLVISGGTIGSDGAGHGAQLAIYVEGDVVINGNITYATTSWGSPDGIPSLRIVARNIYIQPGVSQLDGLYVAQPKTTTSDDGKINSCANNTSAWTVTDANFFNTCKRQLVVNGAFVAKRIYLDRTYASVRSSYPGERIGGSGGPPICADSGPSNGDCAAEIFNFSPEMFFAHPNITQQSGPTTGKYDYITSLSPVL